MPTTAVRTARRPLAPAAYRAPTFRSGGAPVAPPAPPPLSITRRHVRDAARDILRGLTLDGVRARDARARVLADGTLRILAEWPGIRVSEAAAGGAAARVAEVLGVAATRVVVGTRHLFAGRASLTIFGDDEAVLLDDHASALVRLLGAPHVPAWEVPRGR